MLATAPRTIAPNRPALPAAGVIATIPTNPPQHATSRVGLRPATSSANIQARAAAAVAGKVIILATPGPPPPPRAGPAWNTTQPTHRRPVPISVAVSECGGIASLR